jgi:hypothetical protein
MSGSEPTGRHGPAETAEFGNDRVDEWLGRLDSAPGSAMTSGSFFHPP